MTLLRVTAIVVAIFSVLPLSGCARLSYGRQVIAEEVKREHEAEIPLRFWGQLLSESGKPVPGAQLLFEHSPKNWPGYAWGGPISNTEFILIETDSEGRFSVFRDDGGLFRYVDPDLFFWIDGYWQTIDNDASETLWNYENWSKEEPRGPSLLRSDLPAIIQLREFTRESTLISLKHVENRLGPLPQHFQLLPHQWPPKGVTDEATSDD